MYTAVREIIEILHPIKKKKKEQTTSKVLVPKFCLLHIDKEIAVQ